MQEKNTSNYRSWREKREVQVAKHFSVSFLTVFELEIKNIFSLSLKAGSSPVFHMAEFYGKLLMQRRMSSIYSLQ